jgi:predicted nuclease of restriction endonuclease-like (RecB) superfamily
MKKRPSRGGTGPLIPADYRSLLAAVKARVRAAQYEALRAVNKELLSLYWDIGRIIWERQAGGDSWGKSVVERLAADLRTEFPGVQGFSAQNLWYMRQFHSTYRDHEKLQPLVGEISWTKHLVILGKCADPLERELYIRSTKKFGWTKSVLIHQIENQSYEKTLLGQTNFDRALTPDLRAQAKLAVRDEYSLISSSSVRSTASEISNARSSPASRAFSAPWAACSRLWEVSSAWRWRERSSSSISCCSTAA